MCCTLHSQTKDSLRLYKKIKKIAYKHRFTTWAYKAIFVDPQPMEYPKDPASKEEKNVNPHLKYSGRTIRKINIQVYDPFGYTVGDTVPAHVNWPEKVGNRAHVTTRDWIIRNKLLFKENDTIGALQLSETERLLRQAEYVNDARIFITPTKSKDSVDVTVNVHDKWPITVPFVVSPGMMDARLRNQNMFGLGQQFEQRVNLRTPDAYDLSGFYNISNIDNTYISSRLSYQTNKTGTQVGVSFDRPFYSPLTKYAGGLSLNRYHQFTNYIDTLDRIEKRMSTNRYATDVWMGKSFKPSKSKSIFGQSFNVIVASRYFSTLYEKRPSRVYNTLPTAFNTSAYVGNVGFAIQQYYKDKYIYRFGANEDVPEGLIVQFIYGGVKDQFKPLKYYTGLEIARAKHFNFGYVAATCTYGIFFRPNMSNNYTVNLKLNYFTELFRWRRWYFREFLNSNFVYGENKPESEKTTLNSTELYGFDAVNLRGNTKFVQNFETVAYAPYNVIGFRFAPVVLVGLGMISNNDNNIFKSNLYQAYTVGLMLRNENLLNSTFQVSIGLYPIGGRHVIMPNPITSFTLRVRVFNVLKPDFISY